MPGTKRLFGKLVLLSEIENAIEGHKELKGLGVNLDFELFGIMSKERKYTKKWLLLLPFFVQGGNVLRHLQKPVNFDLAKKELRKLSNSGLDNRIPLISRRMALVFEFPIRALYYYRKSEFKSAIPYLVKTIGACDKLIKDGFWHYFWMKSNAVLNLIRIYEIVGDTASSRRFLFSAVYELSCFFETSKRLYKPDFRHLLYANSCLRLVYLLIDRRLYQDKVFFKTLNKKLSRRKVIDLNVLKLWVESHQWFLEKNESRFLNSGSRVLAAKPRFIFCKLLWAIDLLNVLDPSEVKRSYLHSLIDANVELIVRREYVERINSLYIR